MASPAIIAGVLSGGLAAAILTLSVQAFVRFRNRPRLGISFFGVEPGCIVNTPGWLVDGNGARLLDQNGNPRVLQQRYLRLKILNSGKTFAQNTSAYVVRISFQHPNAGAQEFAEEVFDLKLALTGNKTSFNLASNSHRFLDLVHTQQEPGHPIALLFDFAVGAARLSLLNWGAGRYEMRVFAAAENAESVSATARYIWDGTLNGLTISE